MAVVEIEILGRRYALQSDRNPEHVQSVAAYVDEQLRQMARGGLSSVDRDDAVLVALNIASELFLVKEKSEDLDIFKDKLESVNNTAYDILLSK